MSLVTLNQLGMVLDGIKQISKETTPEDIIEWMDEKNVITPLASSSGQVYMTNDNKILII